MQVKGHKEKKKPTRKSNRNKLLYQRTTCVNTKIAEEQKKKVRFFCTVRRIRRKVVFGAFPQWLGSVSLFRRPLGAASLWFMLEKGSGATWLLPEKFCSTAVCFLETSRHC